MEFIALILFLYIMFVVIINIFKRLLFLNDNQTLELSKVVFGWMFYPIKMFFGFLFNGYSNSGFMGCFEKSRFLSSTHKGLLLNGLNLRLSEKESYQHCLVVAKPGLGKTTAYIYPNIFKLSQNKFAPSMIITDVKGEIFDNTSAYLVSKGYKIYSLNPHDLNDSIAYNPLSMIQNAQDIDEIVTILIESSMSNASADSKMWNDGAKLLISMIIKALINTKEPKYITLANARHCLNNFGQKGEGLNQFIASYGDAKLFDEWKGFVSGNDRTILSYLAIANTALSPIGINDNLALLTSTNTLDFKKLRDEKIALFVKVSTYQQKQYSFLLSAFYSQFFNSMLSHIPKDYERDIYALLDEFGNITINNFSSISTIARGYRISISIILQELSQLNKYGQAEADAIINGSASSKIFFSGADIDLATKIEKTIGRKTIKDKNNRYVDVPVISSSEIRTMRDNEALYIYQNKQPLKMEMTPYYKHPSFKRFAKMKPFSNTNQYVKSSIDYINL